jgi:hypothetical protein
VARWATAGKELIGKGLSGPETQRLLRTAGSRRWGRGATAAEAPGSGETVPARVMQWRRWISLPILACPFRILDDCASRLDSVREDP